MIVTAQPSGEERERTFENCEFEVQFFFSMVELGGIL